MPSGKCTSTSVTLTCGGVGDAAGGVDTGVVTTSAASASVRFNDWIPTDSRERPVTCSTTRSITITVTAAETALRIPLSKASHTVSP
ncbi:hypothetical protein [Corynebacterium glyciniphilum]|uniref:hypothetical protein n=1 Tax=Corynebacterium glyciniphilum TaxID=1404244 RepID=UPI00264E34C5|nr:hypothetical protein [Corynebacterium glyciniphilum]MDN6706866.1 hypothetical protein [Corynebacterium glyciniphilum]